MGGVLKRDFAKIVAVACAVLFFAFVPIPKFNFESPDWYLDIGFYFSRGKFLDVRINKLDGRYYKRHFPHILTGNPYGSVAQTFTKVVLVGEDGRVLDSSYLVLKKNEPDLHMTDEEIAKMPEAYSGVVFKLHPDAAKVQIFYKRQLQYEALVGSIK